MKNERLEIRLSKKEKDMIIKKAAKSKMNVSEFLITSAKNLQINVFDKDKQYENELRKIGNNINQLTRLANCRMITCVDLSEVKGELRNIWQSLNLLITK